jgi:serine/threonine protein kinase
MAICPMKPVVPARSASALLLLLASVAETRRVMQTHPEAVTLSPSAEQANESSFVEASGRAAVVEGELAQAGHLLGGRFVLEHFVESRESVSRLDRHEEMSMLDRLNGTQDSVSPGVSFPSSATGFSDTSHLGQGNFGDVWEAYDQKLQKRVAVKIFYSRASGRKRYLTWQSATSKERQELKENADECILIQGVMRQASVYPQGASHICTCYEEHVSQYQGTSSVVYLVLELCGKSLEKIRSTLGTGSSGIVEARQITQQVLEALAFLNMLNPPLIHHDMKLDNAVALEDGSTRHVKLIDWGCFVWGSSRNQYSSSIGDRRYMPPEFNARQAFRLPAYTFDMYGAGLMHMELVCPSLQVSDWFVMSSFSVGTSWSMIQRALQRRCPRTPTADLQLIQQFTNTVNTMRPDPMVAKEYPIFTSTDTSIRPTPTPPPATYRPDRPVRPRPTRPGPRWPNQQTWPFPWEHPHR